MAHKVTLRSKKISRGRLSLYLDIYPPIPHLESGEPTRRKFLGIYVQEKPKSPLDKHEKKEAMRLAEQICAKERNAINKAEIYSDFEKERLERLAKDQLNFISYFETLSNKRKSSNHDNWVSAGNYLKKYTDGKVLIRDVNQEFCEGFREFLLTTKSIKSEKAKLKQNSAVSYFNKFRAALKQAYKDGIFRDDLREKLDAIPYEDPMRESLTMLELEKLAETSCKNGLLKRVALFSALTGLRFSDIQKLIWGEVENTTDGGVLLKFRQQKTKGAEILPISEQAAELMGQRKANENRVFDGLKYSAYQNKDLHHWIGLAGIEKNITFHCFRHTYAFLQIDMETDVFVLSKLLGHKSIKTTQIYAKNADRRKREAADKIKLTQISFE